MAATYAKERHQFGKPIGSFQAVKHQLADARVALEFARPATYRAAWSLATAQPTLSHDASMAKAMASDAADLSARVALQVHGAIGYTWECDLHFFLKRTWALSRAWGDADTHRRLARGGGGEAARTGTHRRGPHTAERRRLTAARAAPRAEMNTALGPARGRSCWLRAPMAGTATARQWRRLPSAAGVTRARPIAGRVAAPDDPQARLRRTPGRRWRGPCRRHACASIGQR